MKAIDIKIDTMDALAGQEISLEDLRFRSRTCCSSIVYDNDHERDVTYRKGYATPLGNIEEHVWISLAQKAIQQTFGSDAYEKAYQDILAKYQSKKIHMEENVLRELVTIEATESFFLSPVTDDK